MWKDDQLYGEWLRVDPTRYARKTVAVILGASCIQTLWWRKNKNNRGSQNTQSGNSGLGSNRDEFKEDNDFAMDAENSMDDFVASKPASPCGDLLVSHNASREYVRGPNTSRNVVYHFVHLEEVMDGLSIIDKVQDNGKVDSSLLNPKLTNLDALKYSSIPLQDCTNQMTFTVPVASAGSTKKWKKRARAAG